MKLLIADDEKDIADAVGIILKFSGFESDVVYNGTDAFEYIQKNYYDGVILDIMMPGMSGIEVLKSIRDSSNTVPVLMLTAKAEVEDRVSGLNLGADDYLAKPFDKNELIARVNVLLRRKNVYDNHILSVGNISLDTEGLEISNGGSSLRLAGKEMEIMELLMRNKNKFFDNEYIKNKFFTAEEYEDGAVTLYITYLKNKLNSIDANIEITSDKESGYCLREKV